MNLTNKKYMVQDLVIDDEYGTIESGSTIEEAAKKMTELHVPDLVVVEKGTSKVLGVIADFDIIQKVVAEGEDPKTTTVNKKMYIITPVNLETLVKVAFERMRDLNVSVVPVVENEKLVGVCSIQDCWGHIPDIVPDTIGIIPVANTKVVEFWFSSACVIMAFVFGILLPMIGVYGFFSISQGGLTTLSSILGLSGGTYTFTLFDVRGVDALISLFRVGEKNSFFAFIGIEIFSIIILIASLIGLFALIYTSFNNTRGVQNKRIMQFAIPALPLILLSLEWIIYSISLAITAPIGSITIDVLGLTMSIFSMVLWLLAIFRDRIFVQKNDLNSTKEERGS